MNILRILSVCIHTIAVLCFGFALIFQIIYPFGYYSEQNDIEWKQLNNKSELCQNTDDCPGEYSFGWKFKYLTFWNLIFQFIIFLLCFVCDCIPSNYSSPDLIQNSKIKALFDIRDLLFHSIGLPIGTYVFVVFFLLLSFGNHLVSDNHFQKRNPEFLSHLAHSILVPILWPEECITYHKKNKNITELVILITITVIYNLWLLYLGTLHNLWPYGILRSVNWSLRIFLGFISILVFIGIHSITSLIHSYIWPQKRIDEWFKT